MFFLAPTVLKLRYEREDIYTYVYVHKRLVVFTFLLQRHLYTSSMMKTLMMRNSLMFTFYCIYKNAALTLHRLCLMYVSVRLWFDGLYIHLLIYRLG